MTLRPAQPIDAATIAEVHIRSWRAAYAGLLAQSFLDGLDHAAFAANWQGWLAPDGPYTTLLAEASDAEDPQRGLLGFVAGGPIREPLPPFDAELCALYILPAAQHRGIGRQLVTTLAGQLAASGRQHLLLWSLRDNPSSGFYRQLGGELLAEATTTIGSEELPTVAFGWRDLHARSWS